MQIEVAIEAMPKHKTVKEDTPNPILFILQPKRGYRTGNKQENPVLKAGLSCKCYCNFL